MSREKCKAIFRDNGRVISDVTWYVDQQLGEAKKSGPLRGKGVVVNGKHARYNDTPTSLNLADASVVHVVDYGDQVLSTFRHGNATVNVRWHEREPFMCIKDCPELQGLTILVKGAPIDDGATPVSLGLADVTVLTLVPDRTTPRRASSSSSAVSSPPAHSAQVATEPAPRDTPVAAANANTVPVPAPTPTPAPVPRKRASICPIL
jgi:hypothetical protein